MRMCPNCNIKYFDDEGSYCLKCRYPLKHIDKTGEDNRGKLLSPQILESNEPYTKPVITCPYCQSTDTKKISNLSKVRSVALFGILAIGKTTKQWHCNKCGSNF